MSLTELINFQHKGSDNDNYRSLTLFSRANAQRRNPALHAGLPSDVDGDQAAMRRSDVPSDQAGPTSTLCPRARCSVIVAGCTLLPRTHMRGALEVVGSSEV
jgi:hypothetical protein